MVFKINRRASSPDQPKVDAIVCRHPKHPTFRVTTAAVKSKAGGGWAESRPLHWRSRVFSDIFLLIKILQKSSVIVRERGAEIDADFIQLVSLKSNYPVVGSNVQTETLSPVFRENAAVECSLDRKRIPNLPTSRAPSSAATGSSGLASRSAHEPAVSEEFGQRGPEESREEDPSNACGSYRSSPGT